ncbi:MAG: TonB family protein [Candidatus Acidiferrales bacterium]
MPLVISIAREEPLCLKASADVAADWGRNEKGYGYWSRGAMECSGGRNFEITVHVAVRPTANSAEFATFPTDLEIAGDLNDDDAQVGIYAVKHGHATIAIMVPPLQDELELNLDEVIELDRVVLATSTGAHVRMVVSIKLCAVAKATAGDVSAAAPVLVQAEFGVAVHGASHVSESESGGTRTSEAFIEQTTTAIIFARGAVVRLAETVVPGQILILRHLASSVEAACRVVGVKTNGGEKYYVELEFLAPAPGFWGDALAAAGGGESTSAELAHREAAAIPKSPAVTRPTSPVPAARAANPGSQTAKSAPGTGARHVFSKLMEVPAGVAAGEVAHSAETVEAMRSPQTVEAMRSAQTGASEIGTAPPVEAHAEAMSLAEASPVEAMRSAQHDAAEIAIAVAEPATVEPEDAKPAPVSSASPAAPPAAVPAVAKWEPIAAAPVPMPARPKATTAAREKFKAAPIRPAAKARSETAPNADQAFTWKKEAEPKRANAAGIAVAAALFGAMAAGAAVYHWQKNPKLDANGAASSQSIFTAPTPIGATVSSATPASNAPLSGAPLPTYAATTSGTGPLAATSTGIAATPKNAPNTKVGNPPAVNARSIASPSAASPASSTGNKTGSAAPPQPTPDFAPEPEVAETRIAAPRAAARSTNQAAPAIAAGGPSTAASTNEFLAESQPSGPAAPPPMRTSSGAQQPRLRSAPEPIYPYSARAEKVQGDVSVDVLIDESGRVASMTVLSGPAMLRQAALDALRQRKYFPAMLDGKPTTAHITVTIHFQL